MAGFLALAAGSCLFFGPAVSFAHAAPGEGVGQWRTGKIDDGRMLLAFSEFEATDDFSGLRFYCKPSSGRIDVHHDAGPREREMLADLIRAGSYPKVSLQGEASLTEPSYSEAAGWEYHFEIAAGGAAFNEFTRTGQLAYRLGTIDVKDDPRREGLDKVSEFQATCRKMPGAGGPDRLKSQQ